MAEQKEKTKNAYLKLQELEKEEFKEEKSTPQALQNIIKELNNYKELTLSCGLKIETPTKEIENTQNIVRNIIENIDSKNSRKFYEYKSVIGDILKFVRDNDILYVASTDDKYENDTREEYDIERFRNGADKLDKKINALIPELETPISKILNEMHLDNSFATSSQLLNSFKKNLEKIYRDGMAMIFKYIVIGEGNKE